MAEIISFPGSNNAADIVRRDDAVARVRALEKQIVGSEGDACLLRMAQGDVLIPIRGSIGHGRWLPFLADCRLSVRNAQIAMQLAEKREEIEAANAKSSSHLSIAAALKLIRPEKPPKPPNPPKPSEPEISVASPITVNAVLVWLSTASLEDKRRVAAALERRVPAEHQQKQARKFVEQVRFAVTTNEAPTRQVENIKAAVEAYDAKGTRTLDWWIRMDRASSFIKDKAKQSTSPVSTVLAHPPTKH